MSLPSLSAPRTTGSSAGTGMSRRWWAAQGIDALAVAAELWLTASLNPLRQGRSTEVREMTEPPSAAPSRLPSSTGSVPVKAMLQDVLRRKL